MVQEDLATSPHGLHKSYFLIKVLVVDFVRLQKEYKHNTSIRLRIKKNGSQKVYQLFFSSLLKCWTQTQRQCSRISSFPWWTKHVLKHAQLCCTESETQLGQNTTLYKSRLSAHAFYVFDECRFHTCLCLHTMLDVQLSCYIIISFPA